MEELARTISYGHEYTVYANDGEQPYKVVKKNLKRGTVATACFSNKILIDCLDDKRFEKLISECEDYIGYSVVITKHRAHQRAIRNLFATSNAKTSHNVRKRPNMRSSK